MKTKKRFVLLCVLTVLLALIVRTAWGNTALMVNTISVSSDRIPAGFSGYRIAQVSDLHNAEFGAGNTKLLQTISENTPNIIVITGDLIDMNHTNMDTALDFVKNAVQIAPIYYVNGNHEAALSELQALLLVVKDFLIQFIKYSYLGHKARLGTCVRFPALIVLCFLMRSVQIAAFLLHQGKGQHTRQFFPEPVFHQLSYEVLLFSCPP